MGNECRLLRPEAGWCDVMLPRRAWFPLNTLVGPGSPTWTPPQPSPSVSETSISSFFPETFCGGVPVEAVRLVGPPPGSRLFMMHFMDAAGNILAIGGGNFEWGRVSYRPRCDDLSPSREGSIALDMSQPGAYRFPEFPLLILTEANFPGLVTGEEPPLTAGVLALFREAVLDVRVVVRQSQ